MITLRAAIKAHLQDGNGSPVVLPEVFGDGYLYRRSSIYRNIRDLTVSLGFRYSGKDVEWYLANPLNALDDVLARKVIPYCPNARAFLELVPNQPASFQFNRSPPTPVRNYVMHESAHCLAESHFKCIIDESAAGARSSRPPNSSREKVIRMLISESFANTCEKYASGFASSETDFELYNFCSYLNASKEKVQNLRKLAALLGEKDAFKFLFFGYLHLNFLHRGLGAAEVRVILRELGKEKGFTRAQGAVLLKVLKDVTLNMRFVLLTTRFQVRKRGIKSPLEDALNFDFLAYIRSDSNLRILVDSLASAAVSGRRDRVAPDTGLPPQLRAA